MVTALTIGGTQRDGQLNAMALQADGKIVAAGDSTNFSDTYAKRRRGVTLARYRSDGSLDPAFGSGGLVSTPAPDTTAGYITWEGNAAAQAMAVDVRGRLVSGGFSQNFGNGDSTLVRHGPNGAVDTTFGVGGWAKSDIGGDRDEIRGIALQPDGRIVTVGTAKVNGSQVVTVARYPGFNGPSSVTGWGSNGVGQLGDNTGTDRRTPVGALGVVAASEVAGGIFHSLAVKNDGSVWGWAWNGLGQVGDGTTTGRYRPVRLPGLSGIRSVSAGACHSLAVDVQGKVWAWGWNEFGQLGDDSTLTRLAPVQVPGLSDVTAVAAGASTAWPSRRTARCGHGAGTPSDSSAMERPSITACPSRWPASEGSPVWPWERITRWRSISTVPCTPGAATIPVSSVTTP